MAYLDNNATTRPLPAVIEAMERALRETWHNPSSPHRGGQGARRIVERARASLAGLLGCSAREIVFTSGGTESADLAIRGALDGASRRALVVSAVEHEAIRGLALELSHRPAHGAGPIEAREIPVTREGAVDLAGAERLIDASIAIVSVQAANNETGALQPVEPIARAAKAHGALFHTDATQWVGKLPIDLRATAWRDVDLLTLSAHKFHGPKGVGALFVRDGVRLSGRLHGTQERAIRGGTENTPGIAGLGEAADAASAWLADGSARDALAAMRDDFERTLLGAWPGALVNGPPSARLWNTSNISFPGLDAGHFLVLLSERGVSASAGAACASGSIETSPVLRAMGTDEARARGAVRFSLSRLTTNAEMTEATTRIMDALRASAAPSPAPTSRAASAHR